MTARDKVFEHEGKQISYREAEVLLCCARGMTAQQTADLLYLSPKTVERHKDNVRTHFGLKGYHALDCFANKLLPELEKWVELPIKMNKITH